MEQKSWKNEERLSHYQLKQDSTIQKVLWNYDEASKNADNVHLFISGHYLVMERGNLFHSLYDLNVQEIIINEESPEVLSWQKLKRLPKARIEPPFSIQPNCIVET